MTVVGRWTGSEGAAEGGLGFREHTVLRKQQFRL
jgi:hypothetical protein